MTTSNGNGFLGREALLKKTEREFADVDIPGHGKVRIRSMTEGERARFEASWHNRRGEFDMQRFKQARVRLIAACVCDNEGHLLFHEGDLPQLEKLNGRITTALSQACKKLNGFDDDDLEVAIKNSNETDGDDSPSV